MVWAVLEPVWGFDSVDLEPSGIEGIRKYWG